MVRGDVQVVSMLTFNSNDPSSNPTESSRFFFKICL